MRIEIVWLGRPITKKNSSQIFRTKSGVPFITPSENYKAYEADSIWQTPPQARLSLDKPVNVKCIYYMPTKGKVDLCNLLGATCDILVKAGVIEDDNSRIVVGHDGSRVKYDKENPRVEIEIEELS
jgi:Holliday junction resolvase RusA-like endonuclease